MTSLSLRIAGYAAVGLSVVGFAFAVGIGLFTAAFEQGVSGHSSWAFAIGVVLAIPAVLMLVGAILLLRRQRAGRIVVLVLSGLGAIGVGAVATSDLLDVRYSAVSPWPILLTAAFVLTFCAAASRSTSRALDS